MSRLTNRIAKLEAETERQTLDAQTMLVEVLARRDALWWPQRWRWRTNEGHIVQRQKDDRAGRYGVSAKSSGRSEWGTAMDLRNQLVAQGLCKPTRSAGGEVSGLTISQHMADIFDLPQAVLDDYYPAFCRFGKIVISKAARDANGHSTTKSSFSNTIRSLFASSKLRITSKTFCLC